MKFVPNGLDHTQHDLWVTMARCEKSQFCYAFKKTFLKKLRKLPTWTGWPTGIFGSVQTRSRREFWGCLMKNFRKTKRLAKVENGTISSGRAPFQWELLIMCKFEMHTKGHLKHLNFLEPKLPVKSPLQNFCTLLNSFKTSNNFKSIFLLSRSTNCCWNIFHVSSSKA